MSNFGDVGHQLTNQKASGASHGLGYTSSHWVCHSSSTSTLYVYRNSGVPDFDIQYDVTNDQWIDGSTQAWPTKFGTSLTDSTTITPDGTATDLYLYDGTTLAAHLVNDDPTGGSGGTFHSTGGSSTSKVFTNFW